MSAPIDVLAIRRLDGGGSVRAFCDIKLGGVTLKGCKIVQQDGQRAWGRHAQHQDKSRLAECRRGLEGAARAADRGCARGLGARAVTAPDAVTVLRSIDGARLTKTVTRRQGGELDVQPYDRGFLFAVEEIAVGGVIELGRLLACLEPEPRACVIRGRPMPGIDRARARRLIYPQVEDGALIPETFEASPRCWIALDFDGLPTPEWNVADLARRREAIGRDRIEHPVGRLPPKSPDDGEDFDFGADGEPAPIDPARDHELVCRAAVSTLPAEFHDTHAWWQLTSSAGIKPGIRLRLWYWCDRPVTDPEAKRWLAAAPVDRSLYSPVQPHYTAAPIFRPRSIDPVPVRSGMWWRHVGAVPVPELPEPEREPVPECAPRTMPAGELERRAEAYARAALLGVENASVGGRHPTLMGVAVRLYSLANLGTLDASDITRRLLAAAARPLNASERRQRCARLGGRPSANEQAIDWARARARVAPDLPEGFRS